MNKWVYLLAIGILISCAGKETAKEEMKDAGSKMEEKAGEMKEDGEEKAEEMKEGAESSAASGGSTVTCKSGSDERTLNIATSEDGGCEVIYTKNGESNSIANAKNDLGYCDKVAARVRGNLESAGFTCE